MHKCASFVIPMFVSAYLCACARACVCVCACVIVCRFSHCMPFFNSSPFQVAGIEIETKLANLNLLCAKNACYTAYFCRLTYMHASKRQQQMANILTIAIRKAYMIQKKKQRKKHPRKKTAKKSNGHCAQQTFEEINVETIGI